MAEKAGFNLMKKDDFARQMRLCKRSNIAVIGCGYTGKAIASLWREEGAFVTATTRTESNLPSLTAYCDQPLLYGPQSPDSLYPILEENAVVYVSVAPSNGEGYEETYLSTARNILDALATVHNRGMLIYLSSTSVYAEKNGGWVDEQSPLEEKRPHARILIDAENSFLECADKGWKVSIFRLGEIYGPGRDLHQKALNYLAHPGMLYGDNYTNMIHVEDIARAAHFASEHSLEGIFNLVDDLHPLRRELFAQVCALHRLPAIQWSKTPSPLHGHNKRIANDRIKQQGFLFLHPDRLN